MVGASAAVANPADCSSAISAKPEKNSRLIIPPKRLHDEWAPAGKRDSARTSRVHRRSSTTMHTAPRRPPLKETPSLLRSAYCFRRAHQPKQKSDTSLLQIILISNNIP